MKASCVAAALVLATSLVAATSSAQGLAPDPFSGEKAPSAADATKLNEEATALQQAGRWPDACKKLAASMRAQASLATQMRLAECYEKVGRVASAWEEYLALQQAATNVGDTSRAKHAGERSNALAPTLDKLVILPPPGSRDGVRAERDGRMVLDSAWTTPQPIDPGEHIVHVWAPGKVSFDTIITAGASGATWRVQVPTLEDAAPWRLRHEHHHDDHPGEKTGATSPIFASSAPPEQPSSILRPAGFVLGIAGLTSLSLAGVFYIDAYADNPSSPCGSGGCAPTYVLLGAGAVALVTGMLLVLAGR